MVVVVNEELCLSMFKFGLLIFVVISVFVIFFVF